MVIVCYFNLSVASVFNGWIVLNHYLVVKDKGNYCALSSG